MSMSDPISDFLTRIRNGLLAKKRWVDVPSSAGDKNKETIRVFLKYDYQGNPVIDNIKRISRPGLRVYVGAGEAPRVLDGLGISILSTSKGVLSNKKANHLGVGGEILCEVY